MSRKAAPSSKYLSLRARMALTISGVTLFSALLIVTLVYYIGLRPYLIRQIQLRLLNAVQLAALSVDVDTMATLAPGDDTSATYQALRQELVQIRNLTEDARFVSTLRLDQQGQVVFLVDAEPQDSELFSPLFSIYEEPTLNMLQLLESMDAPMLEPGFHTDEYGTFLTACAPLYTTEGEPYAVLCIDIEVSTWQLQQRQLLYSVGWILLLFLPLMALLGWFTGQRLAAPLQRLLEGAQHVARGDFTYRVEVATNDETQLLGAAFNTMAGELQTLVEQLEQRVIERTAEFQRQAAYLRAAGEVGRVAASILNWNELLEQAVQLVSERFGFYHAGVFLLDDSGEWAVLRAASSPGGRRMVARGHRLGVGSQSIVGYVAQSGRPRIALDVGEDAVWFDNPDLPETRSEMALPLSVRGRIIGVLDVQSRESGVFGSEDITTLRILADQIAIAIANAQLFEESSHAFQDLERAYGAEVQRGWLARLEEGQIMGYRYTATQITPLAAAERLPLAEVDVTTVLEGNVLLAPLRFSGALLGVLRLKRDPQQPWTTSEIEFVRRNTMDIAQALQNANLVEQTRMAAASDRLIAEIADRLRSTLDPDQILKNTVRELGRALDAQLVAVELSGSPDVGASET